MEKTWCKYVNRSWSNGLKYERLRIKHKWLFFSRVVSVGVLNRLILRKLLMRVFRVTTRRNGSRLTGLFNAYKNRVMCGPWINSAVTSGSARTAISFSPTSWPAHPVTLKTWRTKDTGDTICGHRAWPGDSTMETCGCVGLTRSNTLSIAMSVWVVCDDISNATTPFYLFRYRKRCMVWNSY